MKKSFWPFIDIKFIYKKEIIFKWDIYEMVIKPQFPLLPADYKIDAVEEKTVLVHTYSYKKRQSQAMLRIFVDGKNF